MFGLGTSKGIDCKKPRVNLCFNQDQSCFVCSYEDGTRIYNIEPLAIKTHLKKNYFGSFSRCEMLYRTNILAFVPNGDTSKYADNTVLLWDDETKKIIMEYIFGESVLNVKLRKDKVYVALRKIIYVFSFPIPSPTQASNKLYSFETCENPKGLFEVSPTSSSERQLLVFPGCKVGTIQVIDLLLTEPSTSNSPVTASAHRSDIAHLAINQQSTMIATASIRGTVIRIFNTKKLEPIMELRRGTDQAFINCMNFSPESDRLCCSSDKGTLHIFNLKDANKVDPMKLPARNHLSAYIEPLRSEFKVDIKTRKDFDSSCMCAFGPSPCIYVICEDGTLQKSDFKTGLNAFDNFLEMCDDSI